MGPDKVFVLVHTRLAGSAWKAHSDQAAVLVNRSLDGLDRRDVSVLLTAHWSELDTEPGRFRRAEVGTL